MADRAIIDPLEAVSGVVPLDFDDADIDSLIYNEDDLWWRGMVVIEQREWED